MMFVTLRRLLCDGFVDHDVCRLLMFVGYDVCQRLSHFNDCHILKMVAYRACRSFCSDDSKIHHFFLSHLESI